MELTKTKYKKTELGMLPVDWDIMTIKDVFKFYPTSNYSKAEMLLDGEFGCVHYGLIHAISNSNYSVENGIKYFITREQAKYEFIKEGDVVMVDASEDLVGVNKSVELNGIGNKKLIAGLHTFLLRDSNSLLVDNLRGQILNSIAVKNQMLKFAVGMKVFGVSKVQLKQILIPVPPKEEQKAIATALSDVDDLINNLEKLIAKKKAIKQGAMQQLLTPPNKGGKRLVGFTGDWAEKRLGEIGSTYSGLSGKTKVDFDNGKFPYIIFLNVMNNIIIDINQVGKVNIKDGEIQNKARQGDLFFNTSSETPEEVGMCAVLLQDIPNLYLNSFCFGFRLKNQDEIDGLFISYLINSDIGRKLFLSLAQGATRYNLSKSNFNNIIISVPTNKEQKAISSMLNDIDIEIKSLELKCEKYKNLKQGMMQELLAGRTRLV